MQVVMFIYAFRKNIDTFQKKKRGVFSLGNGSTCDITGAKTVKIKMFDGVVHILGGVTYVSKMRMNLISLGHLDSISCKFLTIGGVMKITYNRWILIKGEKCNGLYHLMENMKINGIHLTSMES